MGTYYNVTTKFIGQPKSYLNTKSTQKTLAGARKIAKEFAAGKFRDNPNPAPIQEVDITKVQTGKWGTIRTWLESVYPKMRKPSISSIKADTSRKAPYFFDSKTLKFFGQTMSSFKVYMTKDGKVYIVAPTYSKDYRTGKRTRIQDTIREYVKGSRMGLGDLVSTKLTTKEIIEKSK